jgi:hypothetical protein
VSTVDSVKGLGFGVWGTGSQPGGECVGQQTRCKSRRWRLAARDCWVPASWHLRVNLRRRTQLRGVGSTGAQLEPTPLRGVGGADVCLRAHSRVQISRCMGVCGCGREGVRGARGAESAGTGGGGCVGQI